MGVEIGGLGIKGIKRRKLGSLSWGQKCGVRGCELGEGRGNWGI